MPEPLIRERRYMPGLDGLRTYAVLAVVAYHLGFGWASGGLLGVAVFFTLSGYLITDLLLSQHADGRLRLRDFWLARARRLLPALFVMLLVVSIWVWADDRAQLGVVRGQVIAGLLYVANWWQSFQHISYFARFGPPSPLNHLWSLAVEEQFYIVWPWLLLGGVWLVSRSGPGAGGARLGRAPGSPGDGPWHGGRPLSQAARVKLAGLIMVLACGSALEMALIFHPGFDPTRVYCGTDTRAFGLLFGAALACLWPSRSLSAQVGRYASWVIDAIGVAGLIGVSVLILTTTEYSPFIYHGGLVLASLFSVMAVAALSHPASRLARALGCRPLRWLGVRSYAIYLWHEPVIALTTPNASTSAVQPLRALLQVGVSIALAALSWRYVEDPIRHGALGRAWARLKAPPPLAGERGAAHPHPGRVAAGLAALSAAAVFAALSLTGAIASPPLTPIVALAAVQGDGGGGGGPATGAVSDPGAGTGGHAGSGGKHAGGSKGSGSRGSGSKGSGSKGSTTTGPSSTTPPKYPHTSCTSVVHIGDSTSDGMISNDFLPDVHQQLPGQYRRVGVKHPIMEITGGTSIVETLPGTVDARTVASRLIHSGYKGCWVIALGTNDVADVYVGSNVSLAQRIKEMMAIIGKQPVMWVNARTLVASGPYAESNMLGWNAALVAACKRYPNVRVYNWAGVAQKSWFQTDGIHYTSDGYAERARLIANGLAAAFPRGSPPASSCLVSTPTVSIPLLGVGH